MRLVAICVLLVLCSSLFAAETVEPMTQEQIQTLRLCVASLAVALSAILVEVEHESIRPGLRAEIARVLDICLSILNALGYATHLEGTRG